MIGFFPEPYPDELLFSICSRYHARTGYRSKESTDRDLFGKERFKFSIDLPCNIDLLIAKLPINHNYTADQFINDYTLLPFYGPFVPPQRLKSLRDNVRGNGGAMVHGRIGILTSKIILEILRFCPSCITTDREEFGETYWHRLHQVPGVEVCYVHKTFLENSKIHARYRGRREAFVTAEQSVFSMTARGVDAADQKHQAYLQIAKDAAWLLGQQGLVENHRAHRERYIGLLAERGYSTYFGTVRTRNLVNSLANYYTPEFLKVLGCHVNRNYSWLHRLVQNDDKAHHPLHHLLLMQFLGCAASSFFQLPTERLPFNEGPWPCLNPVSDHFGQNLIAEYELNSTQKSRKPRGTFRCQCGYAYYRIGPDQSAEARFRMDGCVTLGSIWEERLRGIYSEASSTYKQLALHLGVSEAIVKKEIIRLGLIKYSDRESIVLPTQPVAPRKIERPKKAIDKDSRERNRQLWRDTREANPSVGRFKLRTKVPTVFNWLYKNDKEWLEANSPARQTTKGSSGYIDWSERDAELAREIRHSAEKITNAPGRPIRASSACIAKRIGKLTVISKHGDKLPLTIKALNEVAEDVENYAMRRVLWAVDYYREKGICAAPWQLQIKACLSNKIAKNQE